MSGGRLMIAAPKSGSGKTFLTCGLLKALKNRGLSVRAYKCGPDYIDPMFHRHILGVNGGNLDSYFSEEEEIRNRIRRETEYTDITVIEGVMGYYDGLGGNSLRASSWDIARITETPVILTVDSEGMGLSLGALIKGFREFQKDSRIAAVIANKTSPAMKERLRACVEEQGIPFLGCLPKEKEWQWDSRHLGLMFPEETGSILETIESLAKGMERYLDMERLLRIAEESYGSWQETTSALNQAETRQTVRTGWRNKEMPVRLAIARDEAFCFYYQENLSFLEEIGCELEYFSPIHDQEIPKSAEGLLLGGGYPELYAAALSENVQMRESIQRAAYRGMPILGECGGFLYLLEELEGMDGSMYPMAGVLEGRGIRRDKLVRFGYLELTASSAAGFMREGEQIRGHEFHYWDSTDNGNIFHGKKPAGGREWDCIRRKRNVLAGFPHLYYPSAPSYAKGFVQACREYRKQKAGALQ
ncbi:cobyrinate a,c-diamide synthase [Lachnospiraceae bacterium 62-35]